MSEQKIWTIPFIACLIMQFLYMLSFNVVTPLVAQYVEILGGTTSMAGFIAGIFSLLALAARPFVGFLSDTRSRKRLVLWGFIFGTICIAGYGFSQSYWLVLFFRIGHAISLCIITTVCTVLATDFVPKERVSEGVGYIGAAAVCGMSLGPGMGVIVSQAVSHEVAFFLGALLDAVGAAFVLLIPKAQQVQKSNKKLNLRNSFDISAVPLTTTMAALSYCCGLTTSFLVVVGAERGIGEIAVFYLVSAIGIAISRPFAGKYADKHGIKLLITVSIAAEIACMIALAFAQSIVLVVLAALFRVFGQGVGQSTLMGQVIKDAPDDARSRANATFYIGVDVGQGFGAIAGGVIADFFSYTASFLSAIPLVLLGAIPFVWWLKKNGKSESVGE